MDFFKTEALREGVAHVPDALGARFAKLYLKLLAISGFLVEAVDTDFQPTQGFLERLLESAAYGHDFTHRLHLRRQTGVGLREFFKGETWHLGDHVVDGRLEGGGCGAACDFVLQFIERIDRTSVA